MAKFKFTNKAIEDLSDIWAYTIKIWSEKQAEKYYNLIIDSCAELTKNPKQGKTYFEIYPELFGYNVSKNI